MNAYLLTEARNGDDLVSQVNMLIDDGYTPAGGASFYEGYFTQAMYKKPTKKPVNPMPNEH